MKIAKWERDNEWGFRIDPHDGHCKGQHDIILITQGSQEHGSEHRRVTVVWHGSGGPLSTAGTLDFHQAMGLAIEMADVLKQGDMPAPWQDYGVEEVPETAGEDQAEAPSP